MAPKTEAPGTPPATPPPFEQTLEQLEALVARLESGDLPLEEALASFEQGVRLAGECQNALSAAQQKVSVLRQRDDGPVIEDFVPLDGESGATE